MANIFFNVEGRQFINFSPVSMALLRVEGNTKYTDLNYSNAIGQQMTAGQTLYLNGTPGNIGYMEIKVVSNTTLSGSGSVPIEISAYPTDTQQNQTVQSQFDQSTMTFNLTYNSRPEIANNGFTIDNRSFKNFSIADFSSKFTGFDGNTLGEINIEGDTTNYFYDTNGNNNYVPYIAGTWISVGNIYKLKFVAPDQNNYYVQTGSWGAKDNMGLQTIVSKTFQMAASDYVGSPVQYNGFILGQTTQCGSAEENMVFVFNNTSGNYNFNIGHQYSNSQGYPAQTVRIEGYLDEHFFKNNQTGERIPTQGFTPKHLRNSSTNTIITSFPYNIPVTNLNQLTVELGSYNLTCVGNPNPTVYTPMRYRTVYFRILDSNGNIGELRESVNFITPTIQ